MSQQINLFNPAFLRQRKLFSLLTMLQGLALILLGALLLYAYARHQLAGLDAQQLQSTQQLQKTQNSLGEFTAGYSPLQENQQLQDELKQWQKKSTEAERLVEHLRSGSVGNTSGFSGYLRAFSRQVVPGLWLTDFKVTGDAASIRLSGGVTDPSLVPVYIQRLRNEDVMQGKSFANLQIQTPALAAKSDAKPGYLEFTLYSLPEQEEKK